MRESRLFYRIKIIVVCWLLVCIPSMASPNGIITIVSPFSPGGAADHLARLLQETLSAELPNRSILVETKPGASGEIGARQVAKSRKTTTLLLASVSLATSNIKKNDNYDLDKDLHPVIYLGHVPLVLVTNKNTQWKTLQDIKIHQGSIIYGSSGIATSSHLTGAELGKILNKDMVHIPYKGIGQSVPDLISGSLDMAFMFVSTIAPYLNTNQITPIATTNHKRLSHMPSVPTFQELGHTNFGYNTWFLIMANQDADREILKSIKVILTKTLTDQQKSKPYQEIGLQYSIKDFDRGEEILKNEIDRYRQVLNADTKEIK